MAEREVLRAVRTENFEVPGVFSYVNADRYPLRAHLADVGRKVAYVVAGSGIGVGILMAPVNQGLMAWGIVTGAVAIVTGRALETYLDRQVTPSK